MRRIILPFFILITSLVHAQKGEVWTLQESVKYAIEHNLSIQQNVLNTRLSKLTLLQNQLSQIPNVNASSSYGRSYGRSVDPTTNQFVSGASYDFISLGGNADVLVFGWFQKRNNIKRARYNYLAAEADLDQLGNDISLNVATGYLRALLAQEQIWVSEKQVALSQEQMNQTRRFAEAGRVPELNVAQMEAQLANDSANLIAALSEYSLAILDIKALLNLDFSVPFRPQVPDVKYVDRAMVVNMSPEEIYETSVLNYGTVRSSEYKVKAANRGLWSARGALLPQLSVGAQVGTNWSSTVKEYTGFNISGYKPTGTFIPLQDTLVNVYQYDGTPITRDVPLGTQFDNNFRQTVSINLSIPIFNAWQAGYNVKQSRINLLSSKIGKQQAELKLKQDIYKAYTDAKNAIQKYNAAERAAISAERALDFAQKRYDLGLTNTVDYLTTKNTSYTASSNLARAKYDLIFKLKVIDYYLGKEIKL